MQGNRHGIEGRDALDVEQPAHRRIELGGFLDQPGPRVVRALGSPGHGLQAKRATFAYLRGHALFQGFACLFPGQRLHAGGQRLGQRVRLAIHLAQLIGVQDDQHGTRRRREHGGHEQGGNDSNARTELHSRRGL